MDPDTVIYLGHTSNVPLIRASSELVDGLEPHACFTTRAVRYGGMVQPGVEEEVYPGWCEQVGTWRVVYRVLT